MSQTQSVSCERRLVSGVTVAHPPSGRAVAILDLGLGHRRLDWVVGWAGRGRAGAKGQEAKGRGQDERKRM